MPKPFVLCVSGISTTGKSTIADHLSKKYGFDVISFDSYFKSPDVIPKFEIDGQNVINWDLPDSIDWEYLFQDLRNLDPNKLYIFDSFIPFSNPQIECIVDALINLEFKQDDFDVAIKRRVERGFHEEVPPDYESSPTASQVNFCAYYFKHIVWPEAFKHPEYRLPIPWTKPIIRLNALSPLQENIDAADKFVDSLHIKSSCYVI